MALRNLSLLMSFIIRLVPDALSLLIAYWPGRLGNHLRYRYYKRRLKYLGKGAVLDVGVHLVNPSYISIGDNTHVDRLVTLVAGPPRASKRHVIHKANPAFRHEIGEIHIGRNVHIAPEVYLLGHGGISVGDDSGIASGARVFSTSHHYRNPDDSADRTLYKYSTRVPDDEQVIIVGPVVMEENTALGLNSVMLPGSTIGANSWVGILSSVMGAIPANAIASGAPAVVVKERK